MFIYYLRMEIIVMLIIFVIEFGKILMALPFIWC